MDGFVNGNNVNVATSYYAPATKVRSVKAQDFQAPVYAAPALSSVDADSLKSVAKKLRDKDFAYVINEVKDFNKLPREELPARPAS